jgi:large subunit ribosomal protein L9
MKVLLTKTVDNLGEAGEVVNVSPGYARNFLLPRNLAVKCTPGAMKMAESYRAKSREKQDLVSAEARETAVKLGATELAFSATADGSGQLYGGIGEREITLALEEKGFQIDKKQVIMDSHIKMVGEYKVDIKVFGDLHGTVTVKVTAQE